MLVVLRFAAFGCVAAAALHWISIFVVGFRARNDVAAQLPPHDAPGVSILRPVCGIENHLEATLGSAFRLSYPNYEILFCVALDSDPVIPLVRRLIADHPEIRTRLLIGDDRISINPKLNNVVKGWKAATYDWIAMVDSNVLMPPDYLERLFAVWTPGTGIASSPPVGAAPETLWSELECAFLNTYQARWQLAADAFGLGFAHGKNLLLRRDIIAKGGGINALGTEAAEDAAATKIVRSQGLKAHLVRVPFLQPLGRRQFLDVWRRQLRWARLRRSCFRWFFYPELLSGGFFPLTGAAALAASGAIPVPAALTFPLLWYGAELALSRQLGWPLSFRSPFLFVARDLMLPVLFVAAISGRRFDWRGNDMDLASLQRSERAPQVADALDATPASPNASAINS